MSRYSNTKITKKSLLPKQKKIVSSYGTTLYQRIPETNGDLHVISVEGDRLVNLAFEFYGDSYNLIWFLLIKETLFDAVMLYDFKFFHYKLKGY